jgi:hypothetical protein
MRRFLLAGISLVLIFSSCKKKQQEVTPASTITATIDGTPMDFSASVSGGKGTTAAVTTIHVLGASNSGLTPTTIAVAISSADANALQLGTYTYSTANLHPTVFPIITYSNPADNGPYTTDAYGVQVTTVTITALSSTNVQGTFSGTLTRPTTDATTKTITDGKFNVYFQ